MKKNFFVQPETQTNSSTLNNDSSNNPSPMQKPMKMQTIREPKMTHEWTDEKHSMYLKSIEASFVNQLYDSKHTLAPFSRNGTSNDPASTSGQFKVLRGGCWKRINFERENPQTSRTNQRNDLTANPWIQRYRYSSKQPGVVAAPSLLESVTSTSQVVSLNQMKEFSSGQQQLHLYESHACHHDMFSSDTEMSDQNFVDEEVEGKEENRSNVKRLKQTFDN